MPPQRCVLCALSIYFMNVLNRNNVDYHGRNGSHALAHLREPARAPRVYVARRSGVVS